MKDENEELKGKLKVAEAKAKTVEELRILNAVKIAGGEKALAKLSSTYKPDGRKVDGARASGAAQDGGGSDVKSPMAEELEARRNGTYKAKK